MKLEINIEKDTELRGEIKNLIRGQVKALISEDIDTIIRVELQSKFKSFIDGSINQIIKDKVNNFVEKNFYKYANEGLVDGEIRNTIFKVLTTKINDWCNSSNFEKAVDLAVKAKISKLI